MVWFESWSGEWSRSPPFGSKKSVNLVRWPKEGIKRGARSARVEITGPRRNKHFGNARDYLNAAIDRHIGSHNRGIRSSICREHHERDTHPNRPFTPAFLRL